jgi:uncharacterized protein (DUF849 family)
MTLLKACLNGVTSRRQHPRVPYTPDEVADEARRSVAAGAGALHVHPRDPSGAETFESEHVAATLRAIRAACPGVPVGVSTGLWVTGHDADHRLALVTSWAGASRPDFASVNVREEGAEVLAAALAGAGVGVEAGVWSVGDAEALVAREMAGNLVRILVESRESRSREGAEELPGHRTHPLRSRLLRPSAASRRRRHDLGGHALGDRPRTRHPRRLGGHDVHARRPAGP